MKLSNIFDGSVPMLGISEDPWPILWHVHVSSTLLYIRATIINAANIPCDAIRNATCDLRCHNTRTSSLNDRIVPRSLIYALFLYNILLTQLCPPSHSIVARYSDQTPIWQHKCNFRLNRTNYTSIFLSIDLSKGRNKQIIIKIY